MNPHSGRQRWTTKPTWRTWRQASAIVLAPWQLRRTVTLALIIGSVFVAMNQLNVILAGNADTIIWLKAAMTDLFLRLPARHGRSRWRCAHVREHLAPDGALMIIEPYANDDIADNLTPVGAAYYGFSTLLCTPSSLSQDVGTALGAQAGEARLRGIVTRAGFSSLRRVAETPFNIVLEAKP